MIGSPAPKPLPALSRRSYLASSLLAGLWASGCRSSGSTRPPYAQDQAPSAAQLHAALAPRVSQLHILKARVRDELTPSARFAALIQAPSRIHGSLFLKGQEIMSLVANEEGYGLRYNFNRGLVPGYYHGPRDRCAVQTFLGAPIEIDDLISILMGGGPASFQADAVLSQSWDPHVGGERVVFFDRNRHRSLVAHFIWRDERWVLYAGTGYRYQGNRAIWEWSVRHLDFGKVKGAPELPGKIKIGRLEGGTKRYLELSIQEASTKVQLPASREPDPEDDGWEDDDWEQADGEEAPQAAPTTEAESQGAVQGPSQGPSQRKSPKSRIPSIFTPSGDGLVDRGPLCRGRKVK